MLKHNNGKKQVKLYKIQLDTNFVYLECTKDHLINIGENEWKQISQLESTNQVLFTKHSTEENTLYGRVKDILAGVNQFLCTEKFIRE